MSIPISLKKVLPPAPPTSRHDETNRTARPGIIFLDIFPILQDPIAFENLLTHFLHHLFSSTIPSAVSRKIDVVVGLDARSVLLFFSHLCDHSFDPEGYNNRGFLLGPIIALRLGAAFVPVRKVGKLPGSCLSVSYQKEYGTVRYSSSSSSREERKQLYRR